MLTRREKLLIRPWQQRRYDHHLRKVQSALPAIDVGPPPSRGHVCCKLKKQQSEQERAARIERDNCRLLQRMGTIMRKNRLDNHWVTPPPSFLNRVGIYYNPERSEPQIQEDTPPVTCSREPLSRKERCSACNPDRIKPPKSAVEDRSPWLPKRRISLRTSSTTTKVTSSSSELQYHETRDTSQRLTLTRGGLHLAVNFPANVTIRLEDGQYDRVLQREYCECKALNPPK
ncbi:uncharacterized protein [Periplaneta americana]|uniref:uncharacterized protein n=1 Tax=Periplaneta americana TaxID=6978 RepID=UPI0037E7BA85